MNNKEYIDMNLKDHCYDDFLTRLSCSNIKLINSEFKKKHLDIKNSKKGQSSEGSHVNKETFLNIMFSIFSKDLKKEPTSLLAIAYPIKKDEMKEKILMVILEKLFNRFKIVNCEIKSEKNRVGYGHEYYYVNEISGDQHEIDTYEFTCALCMFPKIDFKEKIKLLFDITDVDEDGYINEEEIRSMIFIVNFLFCDEEAPLQSTSSIINQSLASIKSQQMFSMIMKYPGELFRIVSVEKYVDFDQFYNAISKLENFKYSIIPSFISFKQSLSTKKFEPEFEIEKKNLNNFLSITNEICSNVKSINNEIIRGSKDIRKLIDPKAESKGEKKIKKRNYIDENIKQIKHNLSKNNELVSENDHYQIETSSLPIIKINSASGIKYGKDKVNKNQFSNTNLKDYRMLITIPNEVYNLNYNKISNLETHPGKIKVKEAFSIVLPFTKDPGYVKTENSEGKEGQKYSNRGGMQTNRDITHTQQTQSQQDKKKIFISYGEIIQEMKNLSNKQQFANNEDTQEIKRLIKNASMTGTDLIGKLRDSGPSSSLRFGYFNRNNKGVI